MTAVNPFTMNSWAQKKKKKSMFEQKQQYEYHKLVGLS